MTYREAIVVDAEPLLGQISFYEPLAELRLG